MRRKGAHKRSSSQMTSEVRQSTVYAASVVRDSPAPCRRSQNATASPDAWWHGETETVCCFSACFLRQVVCSDKQPSYEGKKRVRGVFPLLDSAGFILPPICYEARRQTDPSFVPSRSHKGETSFQAFVGEMKVGESFSQKDARSEVRIPAPDERLKMKKYPVAKGCEQAVKITSGRDCE